MDRVDVSNDYDKIAEVHFRLAEDEIIHTRTTYTFFEWLGAIGGVTFFLIGIMKDLFGGILYYDMIIELMSSLYSYSDEFDKTYP